MAKEKIVRDRGEKRGNVEKKKEERGLLLKEMQKVQASAATL